MAKYEFFGFFSINFGNRYSECSYGFTPGSVVDHFKAYGFKMLKVSVIDLVAMVMMYDLRIG